MEVTHTRFLHTHCVRAQGLVSSFKERTLTDSGNGSRSLQSVAPTAVADVHPAIAAPIDPVFVCGTAHLALEILVPPTSRAETLALTLVVDSQMLCRMCDLLLQVLVLNLHWSLAVYNIGLRTFDEAIFIPLRTLACLPWFAADVAEFGSAYATMNISLAGVGVSWIGGSTNVIWLHPVFNSITRRQPKHLCHSLRAAASMSTFSASSLGHGPM